MPVPIIPPVLPLVGTDLKQYNNVVTTPTDNPLGNIINALWAHGGGGSSPWVEAGGTVSLVTAGNTVNLNLLTSPLKVNGATGSAGQVLTSNGAAAPTWTTPATGTIGGSIAANQVAFGTGANAIGGDAKLTWGGSALTITDVVPGPRLDLYSDTIATQTDLNLSIPAGYGLSVNADFGSNGQVLTSHGTSSPPTWETPASGSPWTESGGVVSLVNAADTEVQMLLGGLAQPLTFISGTVAGPYGPEPYYAIRPASSTPYHMYLTGAQNPPSGTGGNAVVAGGSGNAGGQLTLVAGNGIGGAGGNAYLASGWASGSNTGNILIETPAGAGGVQSTGKVEVLTGSGSPSGDIRIQSGNTYAAGGGAKITIRAGDSDAYVGHSGGDVEIKAGNNGSPGTNGSVTITPGTGSALVGGKVTIGAATGASLHITEILGPLDLKDSLLSNGGYGSSGQILQTNGLGAPPSWVTVPATALSVTAVSNTILPQATLVTVTGSTQIDVFATAGWAAGAHVTLLFSNAPLVKNTAAKLAGSVDFQAAADSVLGLVFDGTNWQETFRKVA